MLMFQSDTDPSAGQQARRASAAPSRAGWRQRLLAGLACVLLSPASATAATGQAGSALTADARRLAEQDLFAELERDYRIEIVTHNLSDSFHPGWLEPPINVRVEPVKPASLPDALFVLQRGLAAYPPAVVSRNLRLIGLAERMQFFGQVYGATYVHYTVPDEQGLPYKSDLFLGVFSEMADFDVRPYLLDVFHHEFSSVLFKNYPFPEKAWRAVHGPGFVYDNEGRQHGGRDALSQGDPQETSEALYGAGFLKRYARATLEEDFNVFSGMAFSAPQALLRLCRKHPRLSRKLTLWLGFYRSIDPEFAGTELFRTYAAQGYGEPGKP